MKGSSQPSKFSPIPAVFLKRMQGLLGSEYSHFAESLRQPAVSGLRANPLKLPAEKLPALLPWEMTPVPWCSSGLRLPSAGQPGELSPGKHPYHAAGLYYLQEPSAMAVVEILDPQPGERVLDLAAAPGGKATHIVSRMGNTGLLVANDIHPQRVWELAENIERWGSRNAIILNETPAHLAESFEGNFDRVLLDAPCSGEGMFRKSDSARMEWSAALVQSCAARQSAILEQAARMVRPGGTIVYSTCTFAPEENEVVIASFLLQHPEFEISAPPTRPGFSPGRPDWAGEVPTKVKAQLENTVRVWPHHAPGDGHFIARLEHKGTAADFSRTPQVPANLNREHRLSFEEFCSAALEGSPVSWRLLAEGAYLYHLPEHLPDLSGLRTIHPGSWLGVYKRGVHSSDLRFEPAHALALALEPSQAKYMCPLNLDSAVSYLKGGVLSIPGEDAWVLVTFDGHPLGWGKRSKGKLKNYYPKGLRWV